MSDDNGLSALIAVRSAMNFIAVTTDDCGCGCEGAGTCKSTPRQEPVVVVPGLVNANPNALEVKALAHIISLGENIGLLPHGEALLPVSGTKVGAFGSHDRAVQAVEALASYAVPGDMSDIRSPIRSTVYEAITPGGGGGRRGRLRSIGRQVTRRCPPGYANGGQFANATYSNCGPLLFELAGGVDTELIGSPNTRRTVGGQTVANATIRNVGAGPYGESPINRRNPNIPEMGRVDRSRTNDAVESETVAAGNATNFLRIVRRDGVVVKPVAGMDKLATQRNNPELVGSIAVLSANKPTNIGGDELRLFGTGVSEIHYVVPGGSSLILKTKRTLTPRRASALHRQLQTIRKDGDDHGRALKMLAESNPNELTLTMKYKNMDGANDMVVMERNGIRRTVQKWAYLTWYAHTAPGRPKSGSAWRIIDEDSKR